MIRVEVRCPSCDRGYVLDRATVDGELLCPACGKPVGLGNARSDTVDDAVDRAFGGATAPALSSQPTVPAAAELPPPQAVVCPRCHLHFTPHGPAVPSPRGDRPRVLIVEDMQYFMEIASDALSSSCEVVGATTVAEAEAVLARGGIDLMILDLTLEGGEHGRRLLRGPEHKPCPILIYTAKDESEMYGEPWDELARLGADDVVIKGMHVGESLRRKVGTLLGLDVDAEEPIR